MEATLARIRQCLGKCYDYVTRKHEQARQAEHAEESFHDLKMLLHFFFFSHALLSLTYIRWTSSLLVENLCQKMYVTNQQL